jgi:hypothetical protein
METVKTDKESILRIVAIVSPILAIIVSIGVYFAQVQKKVISYEIISVSDLLNTEYSVSEDIKIFFSDKRVKKLFIASVRVTNSGDIPIKRDDFESNIKLDLGEKSEVLKVDIPEKNPPNLIPKILSTANIVEIEPLLLNPGDTFVIQVFASGKKEMPKFDARIIGIKEPKIDFFVSKKLFRVPNRILYILSFLFIMAYGYLLTAYLMSRRREFRTGIIIPKYDLFGLACISLIGGSGFLLVGGMTPFNMESREYAIAGLIIFGGVVLGVVYHYHQFSSLMKNKDKESLSEKLDTSERGIEGGDEKINGKSVEISINNLWILNHWGSNCASLVGGKIVFTGTSAPKGTDGSHITLNYLLEVGKTYEISCFTKSADDTDGMIQLWCHDETGAKPYGVDVQTSYKTPSTEGERIKLNFKALFNKHIRIHLQYRPGKGQIEVSDVKINELKS